MPVSVMRPLVTRRGMLLGAALAAPALVLPSAARAQQRLSPIVDGHASAMPIAVSPFFGGTPPDAELAESIPQIAAADLERSGLFRPIDRNAFVQNAAAMRSQPPRFADWRPTGAQVLVTGVLQVPPHDHVRVQLPPFAPPPPTT